MQNASSPVSHSRQPNPRKLARSIGKIRERNNSRHDSNRPQLGRRVPAARFGKAGKGNQGCVFRCFSGRRSADKKLRWRQAVHRKSVRLGQNQAQLPEFFRFPFGQRPLRIIGEWKGTGKQFGDETDFRSERRAFQQSRGVCKVRASPRENKERAIAAAQSFCRTRQRFLASFFLQSTPLRSKKNFRSARRFFDAAETSVFLPRKL